MSQTELFVPQTLDQVLDKARKREPVLGNQHHEAVDPALDHPRLTTQYDKIICYMQESKMWLTQYQLSEYLGIPHGSVGSQIRNARVAGWIIEKRRRSGGTWEYKLTGRKTGDGDE